MSMRQKEETETMSMKIDQINDKLNNILMKDDKTFIKKIIVESLVEEKKNTQYSYKKDGNSRIRAT